MTATAAIRDQEGVLFNGVVDPTTVGAANDIPANELSFQWQYAEPANGDWVNIVGATNATFTPSDFLATGLNVGVPLRVQATFIDGLGVKETVTSAPTAILVTNPAVNHAPTVVPQISPPGLSDTSARVGEALGTAAHPGLFLPLITNFTDDLTAANQLVYAATLKDGTALDAVGLHFEVVLDAAGNVASGLITGTPTTGPGPIDVLVTATDAGGLTVTDDFTINVLPPDGTASTIEATDAPHTGVTFNRTDLEFVLTQILQAEAGQPPVNPHLAFGLREVAGTDNNAVPGQDTFGSADQVFPTATTQYFQTVTVNVDGTIFDPNPGVAGDTMTTTYASTDPSGIVVDLGAAHDLQPDLRHQREQPGRAAGGADFQRAIGRRLHGAVEQPWRAAARSGPGRGVRHGRRSCGARSGQPVHRQHHARRGLSAPFNSWMTFFGQFFDHGLDLITKGGSGTVFIPLRRMIR